MPSTAGSRCDGCQTVTGTRPYTRPDAGRFRLCRRCHPGQEAR